jgi:predicted transposase/invertase (TIGR01784 family)
LSILIKAKPQPNPFSYIYQEENMNEDLSNDPNGIIDICQDGVFKAIFTKDTPESKAALTSLLSAFIGKELTIVSVTANEVPIDDTRQRQIRLDISVIIDGGELANIEITIDPKPMEQLRLEYYAARLYAGQDIRGEDRSFEDLEPTYQLSIIAGHRLFKDKAWLHRFVYYDPEQNIALGGRTAILTIELSKLKEIVKKPPEEMTRLERWAVYFGYYTEPEKQDLLRKIEALEEGIKMAKAVVKGFTQEQLEYLREMSRHKHEMDWQIYQSEMKKQGIAIGHQELIDLLENGKTLEEAKRILGIE